KVLAEEKIRSMGRRLETLSQTITELEKHPTAPAMPVKRLPLRHVLALPFDEDTTISHYTHRILSLFVQAQRMGLFASYPSGFLYEKKSKELLRYVFVQLTGTVPHDLTLPEPYRLFTLKAANYYYVQGQSHQIELASELFGKLPEAAGDCLFIETDLLKDNEVNKFELQLLQIS
ncbi:MAG: hypothetical protein IJ711_02970, partial [Lachnospiraceae bacterium]|nr:hypothetical protein [Lachnospiraceae bacterium]